MKFYKNIKDFLTKYSRSHVNFCCGNLGATTLAKNLINSTVQNNLPIVFFGLDKDSISTMQGYCEVVDATELGYDNDKAQEFFKFNSSKFNHISYSRYHIAHLILNSGRTIAYLDVDIVVKSNFESEVLKKLKNNRDYILIQSTYTGNPCTGFFVIGLAWDRTILNKFITQKNPKIHDQRLFKLLIKSNDIEVKYLMLDKNQYPDGATYYERHDKIDDSCKLIHFNCVVGAAAKISKMKEYGYWNDKLHNE